MSFKKLRHPCECDFVYRDLKCFCKDQTRWIEGNGWLDLGSVIIELKEPLPHWDKFTSCYTRKNNPSQQFVALLNANKTSAKDRSEFVAALEKSISHITNEMDDYHPEEDLKRIYICAHQPDILYVSFSTKCAAAWQKVLSEGNTHSGTADPPPRTEGLNMIFNIRDTPFQDGLPERKEKQFHPDDKIIRVGILEHNKTAPKRNCHSDIVKQLILQANHIGNGYQIKVVDLAMIEQDSCADQGSVLDMITALQKAKKLNLDIINISQGYHSPNKNQGLERVLRELNIPVICSAGNYGVNNDICYHWPSNFSQTNPYVLSVGAADAYGNLQDYSNYGENTVTLSSVGNWPTTSDTTDLRGTSFAAAHLTGLLAYALSQVQQEAPTLDDLINHLRTKMSINSFIKHRTNLKLFVSKESYQKLDT